MDRAGLVGDDGPTHHGAFDIAYLRCLPNIVLMAPRDEAMLVAHAAHRAGLRRRPGRPALPARRGRRRAAARAGAEVIEIGTGEILREAGERAESTSGPEGACSATAAASARRWRRPTSCRRRGIAVTVADARFAKPIDAGLAAQLAAEHELLVTVEEGVLAGGFGSAVWETLYDCRPGPADPARRAARPLRDPRRAGAAARGGRLHRPADRRARAGRGRAAVGRHPRLSRMPATRSGSRSERVPSCTRAARAARRTALRAGHVPVALACRRVGARR